MIIECGSCNSRFRLDESRITGRGARVRCRKCGEPITVMKADAAGLEEPGPAADGLDLRSIVRQAMETPATAEPPAAEPAGPAGPESDFEKMLADARKEPDAAPAAPPDAAGGAPDTPRAPEQPPAAGPTVDFRTEEELTFTPSGRKEAPAAGGRAPRAPEEVEKPQAAASPEFMMSTADSLDFLKSDYHQAEEKAALDISGNLRIAPAPGGEEGRVAAPLGAPASYAPPPPPPAEPPSQSAEVRGEPAGPERGAAGAESPAGRGWPGAATAEAAAAAATAASASPRGTVAAPPSFPPPRAAAPPARPHAVGKRPVGKRPALKRRQSSQLVRPSVVLLLLLFFALAGGGAWLGFTSDGQKVLRGLVPQVESLWPAGEKSLTSYTVGNLVGYYENNGAAGRMFVIKGQVTNEGRLRRTGVRVHAALLDARNAKIAEKTVYAGNVFAGDVLRKAARGKIEEAMSNPIGGGLANMDIPPGKSIPFMVVFFDAPDGIDSYRLEPRDVD